MKFLEIRNRKHGLEDGRVVMIWSEIYFLFGLFSLLIFKDRAILKFRCRTLKAFEGLGYFVKSSYRGIT